MLKILRDAQSAIYFQELIQYLDGWTKREIWEEISRQPQFDNLIQILSFYQSYRMLEHTLFTHLPIPEHRDLFQHTIFPSPSTETPNDESQGEPEH